MNALKNWCLCTTSGALALGVVFGVLVAFLTVCVVEKVKAHPMVTLQLSDSYVEGDTKICVYRNAQQVETLTMKSSQSCRAVMTFTADD